MYRTVLDVAPVTRALLFIAVMLTALCTIVKPEVSIGLSFFPRLLFWVSHISTGLLGIFLASLIARQLQDRRHSLFLIVTCTGILGAFIAAPFLLLLEQAFPQPAPDDWMDEFALRGWWQALVAEALEVTPKLLSAWYLVNLPLLFNKPQLIDEPSTDLGTECAQEEEEAARRQQRIHQLHDSLPEVLGKDVVALSSDLHYLNVYTTLGKTLILGSLKRYVDAFGDAGIQVHRSNWVMKAHVRKVHITGDTAYCLMSTGLKVPISRSKRKEVKAIFGQLTSLHQANTPAQLVRVK